MSEAFLRAIKARRTCRLFEASTEELSAKFDPCTVTKITGLDIKPILEAIDAAPAEYGFKPFHIDVIERATDSDLITSIADACDKSIADCSHLLIFSANSDGYEAAVEEFIAWKLLKDTAYGDLIRNRFAEMTPDERFQWSTNQLYIAVGYALAAVATMNEGKGINMALGCCPKCHFDRTKLFNLLKEHRTATCTTAMRKGDALAPTTPILLLPIGYCANFSHNVKMNSCCSAPGMCPCSSIVEKNPDEKPRTG